MATKTITVSPSATLTTRTHQMSLKNNIKAQSVKEASPTSVSSVVDDPVGNLKALYAPAARAFVRRDLVLTQTLIEAAFPILQSHPPNLAVPLHLDPLNILRKKWDLLRITLETTARTTPSHLDVPPSPSTSTFKITSAKEDEPFASSSLQNIVSLEPSTLITLLSSRSQLLHTPKGQTPSAVYLPSSVVSALAFAALKLDYADSARSLIENWLALRNDAVASSSLNQEQIRITDHASTNGGIAFGGLGHSAFIDMSAEGYEKVLDVYCLQVLPRLGDWDYAMEFLRYEPELSLEKRKVCRMSLLISSLMISSFVFCVPAHLHLAQNTSYTSKQPSRAFHPSIALGIVSFLRSITG